jgi:hypothetical protein
VKKWGNAHSIESDRKRYSPALEASRPVTWNREKVRFPEHFLCEIHYSISNKDLWRATGQEDINLEIRKRKFRRIGHTLKKEDREVSKAALLWNPQGSRKRGRPKTSWRRSVTKEVCSSWNELRVLGG